MTPASPPVPRSSPTCGPVAGGSKRRIVWPVCGKARLQAPRIQCEVVVGSLGRVVQGDVELEPFISGLDANSAPRAGRLEANGISSPRTVVITDCSQRKRIGPIGQFGKRGLRVGCTNSDRDIVSRNSVCVFAVSVADQTQVHGLPRPVSGPEIHLSFGALLSEGTVSIGERAGVRGPPFEDLGATRSRRFGNEFRTRFDRRITAAGALVLWNRYGRRFSGRHPSRVMAELLDPGASPSL